MKHLIAILIIGLGIIAVCLYARHQATQAREQLHAHAEAISAAAQQEDEEGVKEAVKGLVSYWESEQRRLIPFFRHTEIDELSRAVARLEAHTGPEDRSQLDAELRVILWQIDHIWESDRFRVGRFLLSSMTSTSIAFFA